MQQNIWTIIGISLSSIAFSLIAVLLIVVIVNTGKKHGQNSVAQRNVTEDPSNQAILKKAHQSHNCLSTTRDGTIAQANDTALESNIDILDRYASQGNYARISDTHSFTNHKNCTIREDDIITVSRELTWLEISKGHIISETDIILPDPIQSLGIGEMVTFSVLNRSEDQDIELGYSSNWISKCENTIIEALTGCFFTLRSTSDVSGEVYRISV
jgi:hypothetical protein